MGDESNASDIGGMTGVGGTSQPGSAPVSSSAPAVAPDAGTVGVDGGQTGAAGTSSVATGPSGPVSTENPSHMTADQIAAVAAHDHPIEHDIAGDTVSTGLLAAPAAAGLGHLAEHAIAELAAAGAKTLAHAFDGATGPDEPAATRTRGQDAGVPDATLPDATVGTPPTTGPSSPAGPPAEQGGQPGAPAEQGGQTGASGTSREGTAPTSSQVTELDGGRLEGTGTASRLDQADGFGEQGGDFGPDTGRDLGSSVPNTETVDTGGFDDLGGGLGKDTNFGVDTGLATGNIDVDGRLATGEPRKTDLRVAELDAQ